MSRGLHIRRSFLWTVAVLIVSACGAPVDNESFVRRGDRSSDGGYVFSVDMSDSTCRYTLTLFTMLDAPPREINGMPALMELHVTAVSPSGRSYTEKVGLPRDGAVREDFFSRQYESLYREGFIPSEYGRWDISIKIQDEDKFRGLRGLGLKYTKSAK